MVERLMWPGGVQPLTGAPFIRSVLDPTGKLTVELQSLTGGASLGYRVNAKNAAAPWALYVRPFDVRPGDRVEAKAIRYGYRESAISETTVPR